MSSSSQNPAPVSTSQAFADLAAAIDRRVSSDRAAELLANFRTVVRAEAFAEAVEAARGEYLTDDTRTPEDEAYNQAVSDVVAAIGALAEGGAR
ncbi:MAG: hypothetical protein HOZ81_04855 [Streptomyces sp.]|nr:hypothetical protein [Streptomyces sp.]